MLRQFSSYKSGLGNDQKVLMLIRWVRMIIAVVVFPLIPLRHHSTQTYTGSNTVSTLDGDLEQGTCEPAAALQDFLLLISHIQVWRFQVMSH